MVRTLHAFLKFCYLAWWNLYNTASLAQMEDALKCFHTYRDIFQQSDVCPSGFNLLRQHLLMHYVWLILLFGAPNSLCSSITESKHIKAVKEPYRCSDRYKALGQILLTNQRLDKLATTRANFEKRGMLRNYILLDAYIQHLTTVGELVIWHCCVGSDT